MEKSSIEIYYNFFKLTESLIDFLDDDNEKIDFIEKVYSYFIFKHPGIFFSKKFEIELLKIANKIELPLSNEYTKDSFLHILTEPYTWGGHTRVVERWIKYSPSWTKQSVVITESNYDIAEMLFREMVHEKGGELIFLQEGNYIEKAKMLREIASAYEYVILHIHQHDAIPMLAFGNVEFKRPVIVYNHSQHTLWLGSLITDLLLELTSSIMEFSKRRRCIKLNEYVGIPVENIIIDNRILSDKNNKNKYKEKLGFPKDYKILLSIGSAYKYNGLDFFNYAKEILNITQNTIFMIIGISPNGIWESLKNQYNDRLYLLGYIENQYIYQYYQIADLYIDSFPVPGGTAFIDAIFHKINAITIDSNYFDIDIKKYFMVSKDKFINRTIELLQCESFIFEDAYNELLELTPENWALNVYNIIKNKAIDHSIDFECPEEKFSKNIYEEYDLYWHDQTMKYIYHDNFNIFESYAYKNEKFQNIFEYYLKNIRNIDFFEMYNSIKQLEHTRGELEHTRGELNAVYNSYKWQIAVKLEKIARKTGLIYVAKGMLKVYFFMKKFLKCRRKGFVFLSSKIKVKFFSFPNDINVRKSNNKKYYFIDNFRLNSYGIVDLEDNIKFKYNPKISIILPLYNPPIIWLKKCVLSVQSQYYKNWELCVVDDCSNDLEGYYLIEKLKSIDNRIKIQRLPKNLNISLASNEALKMASGNYILFLDQDDELTRNALYEIVKVINKNPDVELIYSDDDKVDEKGYYYDFQFKPNWSPELLLSYCYISHLKVIKRDLIEKIGGFRKGFEGSQDYDLLLRISDFVKNVYHIPKILYHWRSIPGSTALSASAKPLSIEAGRKAIEDNLRRRGKKWSVIIPDYAREINCGIYKIEYNFNNCPEVCIIIPSKDNIKILKNCINSIINKTKYYNYKIYIIDTGSKQKEILDYYKILENNDKFKILYLNQEKFNFSYCMNYAVNCINNEYILFLNNDTEVINMDWLTELVGTILIDEKIGAVGAKLIYEDKKVQHAGVIIGLNNNLAGHANKLLYYKDGGYLSYNNVMRNYSAVTAACMLTKKSAFNLIGGFDERNFAVAYNDVDYCLKLISNGYRVVYNPYALLYHHEGKTRGRGNDNPVEENNFREKWSCFINNDPYYNPNLSLKNEHFEILNKENINIRILAITHNLNLEGAPISLFLTLKGLISRNYQVLLVSPSKGPLIDRYIDIGVDVRIIPSLFIKPLSLYEILRNEKIDIAILNTIISYPEIDILKQYNIPIIWIIRESEKDFYFSEYNVNKNHFMNADRVVFVSEATKKIYEDFESKNNKNYRLIYNGIDIGEIENYKKLNSKQKIKEQYRIAKNSFIITNVGTICKRKGQLYFVKAAVDFFKRYNQNEVLFIMIGERVIDYYNEIKSLIPKNLEKNIIFIDSTANIFDYYFITDIFVCTSLIESLPRVVMEAMAFELPIISTNVYGIPELIEDGISGILVPPKNEEILVENIELLYKNEKIREKLGEKANERVKSMFEVNKMIDKYDNIIKELLNRN